ncbi:SET domain protein [Opisthorchis viverrini]|uniref:SET domain protein n=1 Tax=Opisthorchis viverrini TaxID=6198 RepID=A0A1S8WGD9_OPIVI|nr:SET domain protein [Opisthorchis viverrini]
MRMSYVNDFSIPYYDQVAFRLPQQRARCGMELSGMSKVSESTLISSSPSCQTHIYDRIPRSPTAVVQPSSPIPSAHSSAGTDGLKFTLVDESPCLAAFKSQTDSNHHSISPEISFATFSNNLERTDDLSVTNQATSGPDLSQLPNDDSNDINRSSAVGKSHSSPLICTSPAIAPGSTFFSPDHQLLNGGSTPISFVCPADCTTLTAADTSLDVNGLSGSHTTASPNDVDRTRMDLTKLDETIDYVLSAARSDDPCEGLFVLPCRTREHTTLSSPTLRANTPTSGHLFSPSPSPTPSSPQSCHATASPLNSTNKQLHLYVSSSGVSSIATATSMPRYVVDQSSGLVQLSTGVVNSQCLPAMCNGQQSLSFVQVFSDPPSSSRIPNHERSTVPQLGSLVTSPQVVFHSGLSHAVQNHSIAQVNHTLLPTAAAVRGCGPLVSPNKSNLLSPATGSRSTKLSTIPCAPFSSIDPLLSPNRAVVISPPMCVVQNSRLASPTRNVSVFSTSSNDMPNQCSQLPGERRHYVHSQVPVSFRQPIVPAQTFTPSCISAANTVCLQPTVPDQNIPLVHPGPTNAESLRHITQSHSAASRKRSNTSGSGLSKRRKTTAAPPTSLINGSTNLIKGSLLEPNSPYRANIVAHEYFEKLKLGDLKSLVSAPVLRPYPSVLPPVGSTDVVTPFLKVDDEQSVLCRKGLKYIHGSMSVHIPKCSLSEASDRKVDSYILRHLPNATFIGPLVCGSKNPAHTMSPASPVCPSPEPLTFENHMLALFSTFNRSPKEECKSTLVVDRSVSQNMSNMPSFAPRLLPMLAEVTPNSGKPDAERSTPPLPLFHMPNPRLVYDHARSGSTDRDGAEFNTTAQSETSRPNSTVIYNSPSREPNDVKPPVNTALGTGPLIDSETGEIVAGHRFRPPAEPMHSDKLHITFTINPSMTGGIPKIVQRIAELLGVEQDSVSYQVTRSGAQITLDQKQSQSEGLMRNLESQLREHFTPLSLHVETASVRPTDSNIHSDLQTLVEREEILIHPGTGRPELKQNVDTSSVLKSDGPCITNSERTRYSEEPVSIVSLLANKHGVSKPCQNCDTLVSPYSGHRKTLDDIAALTGLTTRTDTNGDFIFCSKDCMLAFAHSISVRRLSLESPTACPTSTATTGSVSDSRPQTLVCDLFSTVPVVLQSSLPKLGKSSKRHPTGVPIVASGHKRRHVSAAHGTAKHRRWRDSRWCIFSSEFVLTATPAPSDKIITSGPITFSRDDGPCLRPPPSADPRRCTLCGTVGDASENGLGRLLPMNIDKWLHVNCALWCYEVYETVGGSLNDVDIWIKKAMETNCTHCGHFGAGLPCYNPRCTFSYHVSCAIAIGCMFFTDRGMYCPQHQPREAHPMQLPSLLVNRRVYITRDENAEVGGVIHEEDRTKIVRIGSVCLHNVGQLLPHQIESGYFHTRRYIYPVGFHTVRIYWSMRKPHRRARYVCEIDEADGRPSFRITALDDGLEDVTVVSDSCTGAWQVILSRIEGLRRENNMVQLFPKHIKGEDLYGLSEPHIVRAVESLPGMDGLRDYVFNFGRMELIAEMPLAINPSGCARTEPKMQTYVKRSFLSSHKLTPTTSSPVGFRRSVHPSLSNSTPSDYSKQYQSSRSQQYRRLKGEASSNVILGRSRIQGLGLFAARNLEPQTMVIEYIGELIRLELANKREKDYEAHNRGIYMFRLNDDTVIDATVCGGLARYINHSCQPNCFAEFINFGDHSHIVIITNRLIEKGEELCYDYNFDLEDGGSKIPCLCRSTNCRKWMN